MHSKTESPTRIDARLYRDVMGHYPTGVVMVAGVVDGAPTGMVVGTFSSVSLDPPLVSFMPQTTSETYQTLRRAENICISVMAHDQMQTTRTLASRDADKFEKAAWTLSPFGAPQIDGAVAYIHGRLDTEVEAGDHWITLVAVDELSVARPVTPLLFFQGGYGGFSSRGMTAHVDNSLISAARVAEATRSELDDLAAELGCTAAAVVRIGPRDQMIGASAYGDGIGVDERLGVRLPLVPPLGEAAVAWEPAQLTDWAARVYPHDEDVITRHHLAAEVAREQGFAVTRIDGREDAYRVLVAALDEYARGELTPARERQVLAELAASGDLFGHRVSGDDQDLVIAGLTAPVFAPDADGPKNSGLVLRLSNLPQPVSGAVVLEWAQRLQRSAAAVSHALAGPHARDYERYVAAGLRGD